MGERIPRTDEVTGSNPVCSIYVLSKSGTIMKFITVLSLLLLTSPAFAELTKEELRAVIREEIAVSEKRTREYIDLKIDGLDRSLSARIDAVDKRLGDMWLMVIALVGLIAAAVAIPQVVIAYKGRDWKQTRTEIQQLCEEIKALQNASP